MRPIRFRAPFSPSPLGPNLAFGSPTSALAVGVSPCIHPQLAARRCIYAGLSPQIPFNRPRRAADSHIGASSQGERSRVDRPSFRP